MKALWAGLALTLVACGGKPSAPPELLLRELPANPKIAPIVAPEPGEFDGGEAFFLDGGCCTLPFALSALDGEVAAALVFQGLRYPMVKSNNAWRMEACVPLVPADFYYQVALLGDDDAGVLWVDRVNEAVAVSYNSTVGPMVNVFTVPDAGTCATFDSSPYNQLPGMTDGGANDAGHTDAGNTDAGSTDSGSTDAGSTDAGSTDSGSTDSGSTDSGGNDAGSGLPVKTLITGSCDTLVSPSTLLTTSGGSVVLQNKLTPIAALPFTFKFYGTDMTHFVASSNGYVQLFPSGSGTATQVFSPPSLPNAATPNGVLAPFWDYLSSANGTFLRSETFGTASARHLTLEWTDWTFFFSVLQNERITFQVKLYETSNAVEFHYCKLDANGEVDEYEKGSFAVVGIESPDGTKGVQHSFQQKVLTTAQGLRFQ